MNPICWLTRRRLGAYQDAELGPAARATTQAHLDRCPGCSGELAGLARLRAVLVAEAPEAPEAVWQAFWPQVRVRLAAAPEPEPQRRRVWGTVVEHRRLALGSALAAAALVVVTALAPWQRMDDRPWLPGIQPPSVATSGPTAGTPIQQVAQVVVQSVETADPQSSVMVFTSPESEVTVVWVFGLEPTEI